VELTDQFSAVLAGDRSAVCRLAASKTDAVCAAADAHGILPLVADAAADVLDPASPLLAALSRRAGLAAAADILRDRELRRLVDAFHAAGVPVVLFKGAELAYTVYARPDLRTRADSDVLVDARAREGSEAILRDLGYQAAGHVGGTLITHQMSYVRRIDGVDIHAVDLHWRVANPEVFAGVLTFAELWANRSTIPALGPHAAGASMPHAMLLACTHRVAHHFGTERLIWLYDIHLLASRQTGAEWTAFVALAVDRSVATVCLESIERTRQAFGTIVPADAIDALGRSMDSTAERATSAYLSSDRRPVDNFIADARALGSWAARLRLMREHLFPPALYMREVYAPTSHAPLAMLYLRRALSGARKWLARS
jgi:hypothetical protein